MVIEICTTPTDPAIHCPQCGLRAHRYSGVTLSQRSAALDLLCPACQVFFHQGWDVGVLCIETIEYGLIHV